SYTCTYLVRLYSHLQNYWWHIDYVIIFSSVWQKMLHKLLLIQSLTNLSDLNWVRCRKFMHRAQYNFYIHACIVAPKKIQIFICYCQPQDEHSYLICIDLLPTSLGTPGAIHTSRLNN